MTRARRSVLSLSLVALTTPLVYPQSAQAAAKANRPPERTLAPGQRARCTASPPVAQLTYQEIQQAESLIDEGYLPDELIEALEGVEVEYELIGRAPNALPVVAAIAVAAVAWCVRGALASLVPSALQAMANRANRNISPPTWVSNAIFGCAGGPVLRVLTSQWLRNKFVAAVLAMVIRLNS